MARNSSGSAGWPSRTGSSSTARTPGPARSGTRTDGSRSPPSSSATGRPTSRIRSFAGLRGWPRRSRSFRRCGGGFPRRSSRSSGRASWRDARGRAATQLARGSRRVSPAVQELVAAIASLAPAAIALRSSELAAYHGAEHITIGTYEHGEPREKEHERCGSHLIAPLLGTLAIGNVLAARAPAQFSSPPAGSRRSAPSPPRPRSSRGWFAIPSTPSPGRSRGRGTSSSIASRPQSRRRSSWRWPRPPSPRASSSSMATTLERAGSRPRSSTSPSRRCATATTPTRTSTTHARRCSRTAAARGS